MSKNKTSNFDSRDWRDEELRDTSRNRREREKYYDREYRAEKPEWKRESNGYRPDNDRYKQNETQNPYRRDFNSGRDNSSENRGYRQRHDVEDYDRRENYGREFREAEYEPRSDRGNAFSRRHEGDWDEGSTKPQKGPREKVPKSPKSKPKKRTSNKLKKPRRKAA